MNITEGGRQSPLRIKNRRSAKHKTPEFLSKKITWSIPKRPFFGRKAVIIRLLFLLVLLYALAMIFPLGIAVFLSEKDMISGLGLTMVLSVVVSVPVLTVTRKLPLRFTASDGFMLVFLAWAAACFLGALPYFISGHIPRFADAVFESVSGFTTTGTTVIKDVEAMPLSLLFWRAETHWLGGMGMVVLTVALFPFLGIGGFQMLKAETTGPDKDRITPKITETAKLLWLIYIGLTALETVLLVFAGMGWFDAVTHAFSTMATGGFSSRNDSLAYWHSPAVDWIVVAFMLIASFNFTLLFRLMQRKWKEVWRNSEAKAYLFIVFVSAAICAVSFMLSDWKPVLVGALPEYSGGDVPPVKSAEAGIRTAFFYTASVLTTTGFSTTGQGLLTPLAKGVLFILMFIGGCSGSTAGGVKVIRHVVLFKQAGNELKKIIYPRGVFSVRLNNKVGRKDVVYGVAGFIFLYLVLAAVSALVVASSGLNHFTSFSLALISLGNIGLDPGLLEQTAIVAAFPAYVKWVLSFIMIAGRLELWTAVVFLSRDYWR
ncbi:MAG: TrkH family potassium uptake protein [Treponema sp.]|jgi:trk system potassium uptake protein TrkH|nr:TrkH family potassium uptake protein [Treponema sp.]